MKNFIKEFKKFIGRGNVVDLAVGVIIGGAFGKIVSSLVSDVLMPLIGLLMGGFNFAGWKIHIPQVAGSGAGIDIGIGSFIQNIIDFLIIAACIFIFVKFINKVVKLPAPPAASVEDKKIAKAENEELKVLKEIRDKLK
jgi:large conductance mechanosensitive channel